MKKNLIIANFKLKISDKFEADNWLRNFIKASKDLEIKKSEVVLGVPFLIKNLFDDLAKNNKDIFLGAQNCFWEDEGAYTGEIGPKMLKSMGVDYVILGHSERREYFKETNQEIAKKLERVLKNRLNPIVCIGENYEEKRQELTGQVILEQMQEILKNIGSGNIEKTVLCYEPVWAISSNNPDSLPTGNEIMEARLLMKKFLVKKYGKLTADRVKIIYGGSVDQNNVSETCLETGMQGALIGSASTKPYDFVKIIKEFEN